MSGLDVWHSALFHRVVCSKKDTAQCKFPFNMGPCVSQITEYLSVGGTGRGAPKNINLKLTLRDTVRKEPYLFLM